MPDTTLISGTVTDANGVAVVGARLTVKKVVKGGEAVWTGRRDVVSTTGGAISFSVHRDSTIKVSATIVGLENDTWLTVPDAATANLEDLIPATSTPAIPALAQATFNAFRAQFSGVRTVTESTTLETDEFGVVADSETDIILALPPAADRELPYYIKNVNAGLVTLGPDGIETINREASLVIASGDAYIVVPATGGWETW